MRRLHFVGTLALVVLGALPARAKTELEKWREETDPIFVSAIADAWASSPVTATQPAQREAEYERFLDRVFADPRVKGVVVPPSVLDALVAEASASTQEMSLRSSIARQPSALARSVDAAASNPQRIGLIERSGFIDFIALAVQGTNFVSADETAVTLNLNAAALLRRSPAGTSSVSAYRRRGLLNRVGGSTTFGAKVPEKEITGLTGLPDAETLFDVFVWDLKLRLIGDRDPRAAKWDAALRGDLGIIGRVLTMLLGQPSVPEEDAKAGGALNNAVQKRQANAGERAKAMLAQSWQVALKLSGQHLTEEAGRNKYAATLLADKGLGWGDLTLNGTYSDVEDVVTGVTSAVAVRTWVGAAGLTGTIWKDALVAGYGTELSLSAEATIPDNGGDAPHREGVFKADVALRIPATATIRIPVSVTYTNDKNQLEKQRWVSGRVGINYDFGSLRTLLVSP